MELPPYRLLSLCKMYVCWLVHISLNLVRAVPSCRHGPGIIVVLPKVVPAPGSRRRIATLGTQMRYLTGGISSLDDHGVDKVQRMIKSK